MDVAVRTLGTTAYVPVWRAMQSFTDQRDKKTRDEIWLTEHEPVFTLGVNASREHLLVPGTIPVVQIDRGGQVTYHGPGQLMVYPLLDLSRAGLGVRALVSALEQSVVSLAADFGIDAASRCDAPGVYVDGVKIASVGLRIRRGASFHGMAVNVAMDLEPFSRINPCGFSGLEVTDLSSLGVVAGMSAIQDRFLPHLLAQLGIDEVEAAPGLPELTNLS